MKRGSAAVAVLSGLAPLSLANKGLVGYRARSLTEGWTRMQCRLLSSFRVVGLGRGRGAEGGLA